jgi:hypothetical protein
MLTDRGARVNDEAGDVSEYQLTRPTNVRRIYVDDTGPASNELSGS